MMQHPAPSTNRGFSLLELSIVLIVIALIAGFGVTLGGNILSGSDRVATQQRLVNIRAALDNFVKKNGYLPCPASRSDILTDANFGVERRNVAGTACAPLSGETDPVSVGAAADQAYIGALPVITLGLPASYAADAWGNKFLYAVSLTHMTGAASYAGMLSGIADGGGGNTIKLATNASVTSDFYNGLTVVITSGGGQGQSAVINSYDGATRTASLAANITGLDSDSRYLVSGGNAGTITVRYGDRAVSNYPLTNDWRGNPGAGAIYAVISHGPNGLGAYPLNAKVVGTTCADNGTIDFENCDDTNATFYDTAYNDGSQLANFFDDYIIWGSNLLGRAPWPAALSAAAGIGSGCPAGACEGWCAPCKNTPLYPAPTISHVCSSTILVNSSCNAQCVYAYFGPNISIPCQ